MYDFVNGQRFTTGYPIILNGKPEYSVFLITPTSTMYSKIESIITNERLVMSSLIAGIIAAVILLIIFLIRMNSILDRNIQERTKELEKFQFINKKLESSNELLKIHDKMQTEFIDIAAHEFEHQYNQYLAYQKS